MCGIGNENWGRAASKEYVKIKSKKTTKNRIIKE